MTKIHQIVDGYGSPLAMIVTGGQRNDSAMLPEALAELHVPGSAQVRRAPASTP